MTNQPVSKDEVFLWQKKIVELSWKIYDLKSPEGDIDSARQTKDNTQPPNVLTELTRYLSPLAEPFHQHLGDIDKDNYRILITSMR